MLCALCLNTNLFSQESSEMYEQRIIAMQQEEIKVTLFVTKNINKKIPEIELDRFEKNLIKTQESHDGHNHVIDKVQALNSFKLSYWRSQYFKENPNASSIYSPRIVSPSCANGDFESGTFAGFTGSYAYDTDGYISGDCTIEAGDFTLTPVALASADVSDFDIMTIGTDPIVVSGTLNKVCSGLYSARINSDLDAPGFTRPEQSVSRLSKKVVLSTDHEIIYFKYALVMTNPNGHDNTKPTFKASIKDNSGETCDWLCNSANSTNPYYMNAGVGPGANRSIYKQWECANLQACGLAGDTVELEFIMTDCGLGGHWGYAYIDDICDTCQIDTCNTTGSIMLNPTDTCVGDTMMVCGSYNLAAIQCVGASVDSISLFLYQNGLQVAGPFTLYSPTGGTFCYTVDPSMLPPGTTIGEGFDFYTEIYFNHGAGSYSVQNNINSNPGINNDYVYGAVCCPEFELKTCCDLINPSGNRSAIDSRVQYIISQYKNNIASKSMSRDGTSSDPCCDPCNFPTDSFPVFILDENDIMIDASLYTITWSHDPTNTGSFGFIFPNQQTIVTVYNTDSSCVWSDTFLVTCCSDTITINSFCPWDPCKYPNIPIPLNITDQHGTILSAPRYSFVWSTGATGNTTSETQANLPISVIVHDSLTGCDYYDTLSINCCSLDTPINLTCQLTTVGTTLSWDPVPGAVSYVLYRTINDPFCCRNATSPPSSMLPVNLTGTSYTVFGSSSCFSWRIVAICANGDSSVSSKIACSCDPIQPCNISAPINLDCRTSSTGRVLGWDIVPLATSYEIEFTYNDPACCPNSTPSLMRYVITGNTYSIPYNPCTSWKVRAICADGTKSSWSNGGCLCRPNRPNVNYGSAINKEAKLTVYPNPSRGDVSIVYETKNDDKAELTLVILDVSGREVHNSAISSNQTNKLDLSELQAGLYICVIKSESEILEQTKLILK